MVFDGAYNAHMMVVKRSSERVHYDVNRIYDAISPAWERVHGEVILEELDEVVRRVDAFIHSRWDYEIPSQMIQDVIETTLQECGQSKVAESYTTYRLAKAARRAEATDVEYQVGRVSSLDEEVINENANKDGRQFHTQRDLLAGSVSKAKALTMLPPSVAQAHVKGQIHYHDLDYSIVPMSNCSLPDFAGMMSEGFTLGNARVESPKSILTAATVLSQAVAAVASSQYGGVTVEAVDLLLEPYAVLSYKKHLRDAVRWLPYEEDHQPYAEEHTKKDIYDAIQTLEYQVNSLMTTNGQTPFTTVGFGLGTSWFAREIQKAVLQVRIDGLGKEKRTAIFPKLVFTIKKGLNDKPGTLNYDIKELALECSTKRMYPDVLSYENIIEVTGSYKTSMGCRSYLSAFQNDNGDEVTVGRMNLGVVTLNLPRIALETRNDLTETHDQFWKLLDDRLEIMHEALRFREAWVRTAVPQNAPILYMEGGFGKRLKETDSVGQLFDNGRATMSLGYIGLYEVATVFYGPSWENNETAKKFTVDIVKYMKAKTVEWNKTDLSGTGGKVAGAAIGLYATPSESLADRFARMDLEKFGPIEHVTVKGEGAYYTNSFHLDVRKAQEEGWSPFSKVAWEVDYPRAGSSGGFITYVEYPVLRHNLKALETVWDYALDQGVAYLGTNTPIDHCFVCDFEGDFIASENGFTCPTCGNDDPALCSVVKRTCGYLGEPASRPWAAGRAAEHRSRKKHVETC